MSKKNRLILFTAVGILVVVIVAGLILKSYSQTEESEVIPLVRSTVVKNMGSEQSYTYSGVVKGRHENLLAFQVGGKVIGRYVDLGSAVKPGEVIMQIDPQDIQKEVDSSEAQVSAAESQYRLAKDNLDRYEKLYEGKVISKADYDSIKNAADASAASYRQAQAQYEGSSNKLNYCRLYSDNSGVVASVNAEIGQIIGAGQTVATLVPDGEKEIEINIPENRLEEICSAQQIKVSFWALPDVVLDGQLREVSPMADSATHTYKMRVSLLDAPPQLKLGMTAAVTVVNQREKAAVFLPLAAVYQTGDTPSVWVVNEGVANLRLVKIGTFGDNQVQVMEGLNEGDIVVTAGVHKLKEGQKVRLGNAAF